VKGEAMEFDQRIDKRRKFGYYMRAFNNSTNEILGYLSDISPRGFKLEGQKALSINKDYSIRLELTSEISEKSFIVFIARALWSQPDPYASNEYTGGFRIISISLVDEKIYNRIFEKYGSSGN
jgi:hypothetical protein